MRITIETADSLRIEIDTDQIKGTSGPWIIFKDGSGLIPKGCNPTATLSEILLQLVKNKSC